MPSKLDQQYEAVLAALTGDGGHGASDEGHHSGSAPPPEATDGTAAASAD